MALPPLSMICMKASMMAPANSAAASG